MPSGCLSFVLRGLDALAVEVEATVASRGLPHTTIVGLPDAAVRESIQRVRSALAAIGRDMPRSPLTINLAPAHLRKEGPVFDLPMALGLLAADGAFAKAAAAAPALQEWMVAGELALDGRLRSVSGAVSMAMAARSMGLRGVIVPAENAAQAAVVRGITVLGATHLKQVVDHVRTGQALEPFEPGGVSAPAAPAAPDFGAILGQELAKRAMAIAAAGGTFQAPPSTIMDDPNKHLFGNLLTSNGNWWTQRSAYPQIPANQRFPSLKAMSKNASSSAVIAGLGAPGIVTQMDVLNSIGPNLTARSDTFVIRAYGEALDDAGNVIGKAWVEVVVQRTTEYFAMAVGQKYPDYVEPNRRRLAYRVNSSSGKEYDKQVLPEMYETATIPTTIPNPDRAAMIQEQKLNRILGRRFRPASLRWLTANEI